MDQFREWVSDNLRYIMLLVGILAVLLAAFFGVRALTGAGRGSSGADAEEVQSSETAAAAEADTAEQTEQAEEPTAAAAEDHGQLIENADPGISKLISDYYAALGARDLAAVRTLTDTLPEADAVGIEAATTQYSDIHVYTKNGPAPGSNVVFTSYLYQNESQSAPLPGLSQMLVKKAADGNWQIVFSEQDAATQAYMEAVRADEDVQTLIAEVTSEYEVALKTLTESAATTESDAASEGGDVSVNGIESTGTDGADAEQTEGTEAEEASGKAEEPAASDPAAVEEGTEEAAEPAAEEAQEEAAPAASSERTAAILSSCNVRSGPGYDYQILGEVRTGTYVTVIGELENGWWHIRTDYLDGYVGGKFLPEA